MEQIFIKLGERIRCLRRSHKLSQERLAEKTGLHPTYISRIEMGRANPTIGILQKIADGLEIDLDQLICGLIKDEDLTFKITGLVKTFTPKSIRLIIKLLEDFHTWQKDGD